VNEELDGVMGMYCAVSRPGTIAIGDEVEARGIGAAHAD
jgi:hypothetical protein